MATRLRGARSVTRQRHRLQASLVVAQVGMATLLLVVSGLLGRTLLHLDAVDPRFEPDGLMTVRVAVPGYRFLDADGTFRRAAYAARFDAIEAALAAVPGVTAVARASTLPFDGGRANNRIEPEGYAAAPGEQLVGERTFVSGDYLRVIGARLLEGRLLEPADDRADALPVMVVSQRLARRFWPDGSALGRRIGFWAGEFTVVGVIEDMHDRSLEADEDLRFYVPAKVAGETADGFVLRTAGPPERHAAVVRERIAALDPDLPVLRVAAMRERMGATLSERRYRARLVLGFAALALVFAASGIYGAMNRRVALRRHEIGVRMALGARRTGVLAGVLRESVRLTLTGVVLGAALALACSRLVAAWLSGVPATDPLTYAAIALVLGATATLAALAPSLRAARVDPLDSLRGG